MKDTTLLNKKIRHWLICIWVAGLSVPICGQNFEPHADNVFVNPDGATVQWNILNNDELGGHHWSEVDVAIVTAPTRAAAVQLSNITKRLSYRPQTGFVGRDSLQYSVYCPSKDETKMAWVYINIIEKPDNIFTDMCTTTPPAQKWDITYKRTDAINLSTYQNAIAGDIDGDGIVEIVVGGDVLYDGSTHVRKIYIYKGTDLSIPPTSFEVVSPFMWGSTTKYIIGKTQLAGKDSTLIVVAEGDRYLRAYNYHGELVWTSDQEYHNSSNSQMVSIHDMNNDGIPEIIISGKIFDSTNGKLLCNTGVNGATIAADLFNTGELNLIVNNRIYKPNATLTSISHVRTISPVVNTTDPDYPGTISVPTGGFPIAVDMDNDGKLELIISYNTTTASGPNEYTFIYIADPATGVIKASKYIPNAGAASYPFIGDIDGDGYPEIVIIKNKNVNFGRGDGTTETSGDAQYCQMLAYKYNIGNPILEQFWEYQHYDYSGATGMTLFDFNLDGIAEIVYRDEWNIRIINGSGIHHETGLPTGPYNLASFPNHSGTSMEYPTVADVDGDGQAEILMVGAIDNNNNNGGTGFGEVDGPLWIFKSADPENSPWAPARKVWNQYAFNPVYINQDLTVPVYPLHPATEFITKNGTRHRPFNHFMQQVTDLNDEGLPLFLAPDLAFVFGYPVTTYYNPSVKKLDVGMYITNQGNEITPGPFYISVYMAHLDGTYTRLYTDTVHTALNPGDTREVNFSFDLDIDDYPPYKAFEVRLNEIDGVFLFDECAYSNNYSKGKMFTPSERVICENETETMSLIPQGVYRYEWYRDDGYGGKTMINYNTPENNYVVGDFGQTFTITKNSDKVEYFFVLLYDLADPTQLLSIDYDTISIYLAPDTLIWTGEKSDCWHNYGNWLDPTEVNPYLPELPMSKVPRPCTNVLIPDDIEVYPNLSASHTDYTYYLLSECANITFEHGGEVVRTDSLHYDAAYIHQQLNSNRWYMIAPPLRDFYPGDYYVKDPNPHNDDVYIYTALFSQTNPANGLYIEGKWTGTFHNPDISMGAGSGMAVWIDDKQPDVTIHDPYDFYFPKNDLSYTIYDWNADPFDVVSIGRGNQHRFVYEEAAVWNRTNGDIRLPLQATGANKKLLLGNPFMTHWDFADFYSQNAATIRNYYQILDADGQNFNTYIEYNPGGLSGTDTGINITTANPPLSRYIPPMQSILVESAAAFTSLTTHVTATETRPGEKLRSVPATPEVLYIDIDMGNKTNRTAIVFDKENTMQEEYGSGVRKTILKESTEYVSDQQGNPDKEYPYPVAIYTLDKDNTLMDIQLINTAGRLIPLGISTLQTGKATLRFSIPSLMRFATEYDLFLIDKAAEIQKKINIREFPQYEFEKQTEDVFIHDRFYIELVERGMSIQPVKSEPTILMATNGYDIRVFTTDGKSIRDITLTDLQGRVIQSYQDLNLKEFHTITPAKGVFILKAYTDEENAVFKIRQ